MSTVIYEVTATIQDSAVADAWVRWMRDEHITDVMAAGAKSGRLFCVAESGGIFVAHYEFQSQAALDSYFRDHAPQVRAAGLKRFPPEKVSLTRRVLIPPETP